MADVIHMVKGVGKHYLGVALTAMFIVLVVAFTWGYAIPKLRSKSATAAKFLPGQTAPAGAAAAKTGYESLA